MVEETRCETGGLEFNCYTAVVWLEFLGCPQAELKHPTVWWLNWISSPVISNTQQREEGEGGKFCMYRYRKADEFQLLHPRDVVGIFKGWPWVGCSSIVTVPQLKSVPGHI